MLRMERGLSPPPHEMCVVIQLFNLHSRVNIDIYIFAPTPDPSETWALYVSSF